MHRGVFVEHDALVADFLEDFAHVHGDFVKDMPVHFAA